MLNILVNAYAVNPEWGSEPGMGWNWVSNLAKYCNLHIITEGEWREEIECAVSKHPYKDHLHFHYNTLPDKIRKMCWNQGDWRFYWYYRKWQKRTLEIARRICNEHRIDIIHQLNMVGFREPGYLWKIKEIPFVWGPVGGMELMPVAYFKDAPNRLRLFSLLKNAVNDWQRKHSGRVRKTIEHALCVIAATDKVADFIRSYHGKEVVMINETGCYRVENGKEKSQDRKTFDVLWVGRFIYSKQLPLAIKAIIATKNTNIRLHICGEGSMETVDACRTLLSRAGCLDRCEWHGRVKHDDVLALMHQMDIMLFTSIMEATSTVVLEAMQAALPVVSFDTCGFGPIVSEFGGITIPLTTPERSVKDFGRILNDLEQHREKLEVLRTRIIQQRDSLTWEAKAAKVMNIYNRIADKGKRQSHASIR
ncbi:glycosyltransferase family 4 protein [Alistipes sp.]|uniref:glycosyltransferase family 4 protein n=1 Tax=Alistipes sp. TaxID=1872444 RepID=UPI003AEF3512